MPPPWILVVSNFDTGTTMQVAAGGLLRVRLPGNPSTGYIWQIAANDESILKPSAYEFTADADIPGAGGVEQFDFNVVAPGTVELKYVYGRPWETDVDPAETFAMTVEAVADWPVDGPASYVTLAENGGTTSVLSGSVMKVVLAATDDGGAWKLVATDPMIVQPLGDWVVVPDSQDATQVTFERAFLGVDPGTTQMQFEYVPADAQADVTEKYAVTVVVPPVEPGSSGAVIATDADAGKNFALVTGDTLVVQLPANYTTGYSWKLVSTNDTLLPSAGDEQYALSSDLMGGGGVATFRFLAKAAGEATVQLGEFAPGADDSDTTLDFNAMIVDPAPLTGNTVTLTDADAGKPVNLVAGDLLQIAIPANPSTGYQWVVTQNDGALLRLQPDSGFKPESDLEGAPGTQIFLFRSLQPGSVGLQIGEFPPGAEQADKTLEYAVTIE
ncbi:MAG: protease inhibitor I42 family protein [Anaerolineales bacterium]|nr:protease inhibitor I42 family protein [Anaerolineales bacterium]